jgi:hypothetical protein
MIPPKTAENAAKPHNNSCNRLWVAARCKRQVKGTAVLGTGHSVDVSAAARRNAGFGAFSAVGLSRRNLLQITGFAGAAIAFSGCSVLPTSFRCRVTVAVNTSQGVKTGSGVWEVEGHSNIAITAQESLGSIGVRGQAIVVELPGGPLFVLAVVSNSNSTFSPAGLIRALLTKDEIELFDKDHTFDSLKTAVRTISGAGEAERKGSFSGPQPMNVRFKNLNDPKSIEEVYLPSSISVQSTNAPVSTGIEKRFPAWFMEYSKRKAMFDGNETHVISSNDLAANTSPGIFSMNVPLGEQK